MAAIFQDGSHARYENSVISYKIRGNLPYFNQSGVIYHTCSSNICFKSHIISNKTVLNLLKPPEQSKMAAIFQDDRHAMYENSVISYKIRGNLPYFNEFDVIKHICTNHNHELPQDLHHLLQVDTDRVCF